MWTIPDSTHDLLTYLKEQLQLFKMTKMWKCQIMKQLNNSSPSHHLVLIYFSKHANILAI